MRSSRVGISAIVACIVLAACGEDREGEVTIQGGTGTETTPTETTSTETTTAPSGETSQTFTVSEVEFKLRPAEFELPEPGAVEFVARNDGKVVHALEVEGPGGEVETEEIQPGDQARLKVDAGEPGTYKVYCPIGDHEQRGMVGELRVAGGGTGGPSTTEEEQGGDGGDEDGGGGSVY